MIVIIIIIIVVIYRIKKDKYPCINKGKLFYIRMYYVCIYIYILVSIFSSESISTSCVHMSENLLCLWKFNESIN